MMEQMKDFCIEGTNVILRFAKASDLDAYFEFLQDPEMNRLTGAQRTFTREEIAAWLDKIGVPSEERADFMILTKDTNELIGEVVINEVDPVNRRANIRIGIQGTQHRGKGHGTEALVHMLRYGFEHMKLHRIDLGVYVFNPRAIHVYEKIGFVREGIERDAIFLDGKFHDMIVMSMLEDEYRAKYSV